MASLARGEPRAFLSAEWRDLVILNYEVEPQLLTRFVPPGTVLDSFDGRTYVSLVGFQFRRTKLFGSLPIPFHTCFDEVNLRLYVLRNEGTEARRGVVFIAEVVPKWAVARLARLAYRENYFALPMRHSISGHGAAKSAEYAWKWNGAWCKLYAHAAEAPGPAQDGSLEQFITEHYWGYSAQPGGHSLEYHVSHPRWNVWRAAACGFEGDVSQLYGSELAAALDRPPDSGFIADGSPVVVSTGRKIAPHL